MRDKIESFLRRVLIRKEGCSEVDLRSAAPGSKGREIDRFPIPEVTDENVRDLAISICDAAQDHADTTSGVVRYEIGIIRSGDTVATYAFRVRSQEEVAMVNEGDERPNSDGCLRQMMRHHEAMAKMYMAGMTASLQTLSARVETDERTIAALRAERAEHYALLERARSEEASRELEMARHVDKQRLQEWGIKKVETLLPMVIARLGKKPLAAGSEKSALMELVHTLDSDQLAKMASALTPEQQVVFFALLQELTSDPSRPNHS